MMYNNAELKAMQLIASKLDWHKPVDETILAITRMVKNQQALELDCIGECDDFETIMLSMCLWTPEKILSTQYINDYHLLIGWATILDKMHLTPIEFAAMCDFYSRNQDYLAEYYEAVDEYLDWSRNGVFPA